MVDIFFKLPKLFFQFPLQRPGHTGDSISEDQINALKLRDRLRRRSFGSIMRLLISTFLEAMVYCSDEILKFEKEEEQQSIPNKME